MFVDFTGRVDFPAIEHVCEHESIVSVTIPVDDRVNLFMSPRATRDNGQVSSKLVGGEATNAFLAQHSPAKPSDLASLSDLRARRGLHPTAQQRARDPSHVRRPGCR